jgi:hypothetical protein
MHNNHKIVIIIFTIKKVVYLKNKIKRGIYRTKVAKIEFVINKPFFKSKIKKCYIILFLGYWLL